MSKVKARAMINMMEPSAVFPELIAFIKVK
jgi:hypothetical protein